MQLDGHYVLLVIIIPTMIPYSPRALAKISTMSIDTKVAGACAWVFAVPDPMTPTESPQNKLLKPTVSPAAKKANPVNSAGWNVFKLMKTVG